MLLWGIPVQSPAGFSSTNNCTLCSLLQFALQHGTDGEVRQPHAITTAMATREGDPPNPNPREDEDGGTLQEQNHSPWTRSAWLSLLAQQTAQQSSRFGRQLTWKTLLA